MWVWVMMATTGQAADLQVTCEPGVRIYVDGELKGVSRAEQDGLYLRDLPPGSHVVTFRKRGFADRAEIVEFKSRRAIKEIVVQAPAPSVTARVAVSTRLVRLEAQTGTVDVRCIPAHCEVEVADHRIELAGGVATFRNVLAESIAVTATRDGLAMTAETALVPDGRLQILADFTARRLVDEPTGAILPTRVTSNEVSPAVLEEAVEAGTVQEVAR